MPTDRYYELLMEIEIAEECGDLDLVEELLVELEEEC